MIKPTVLILEDMTDRQEIFRKKLQDCTVVIVEEVFRAIQELRDRRWDHLFLDHDLGGKIMVPSGPGTGYEVACWLELHPDKKPRNPTIVHSLNFTGSKNIKRALPEAILAPGCWAGLGTDFFLS